MFGSLVVREIVQENRAQYGALGFYISGKTACETVVGRGH